MTSSPVSARLLGDGFVTMHEATRKLGVSRQTVLQRVKRGELEVVHVTKGRKKESGSR